MENHGIDRESAERHQAEDEAKCECDEPAGGGGNKLRSKLRKKAAILGFARLLISPWHCVPPPKLEGSRGALLIAGTLLDSGRNQLNSQEHPGTSRQ